MSSRYGYEERRPSSGGTTKMVLIIVGGIVLVVAIVCGGGIYVAYTAVTGFNKAVGEMMHTIKEQVENITNSTQAAQQFVKAIEDGDLDEAYDMTSKEFRERYPRQAFDDTVKKHGLVGSGVAPGEPDLVPTSMPPPGGKDFTFTGRRRNAAAKLVELRIDVRREGEDWLIEGWRVRPAAGGAPPDDEPKEKLKK